MHKIISFLSILLSIMVTGCNGPESQQQPPNVIFILADDMGYGDVSAYNENSKINTKNLDKLAEEGMIFTDAHTSSAVCSPTRYGILTGRYNFRSPMKSGVLNGLSDGLIELERTTVASMLQQQGYHTGYIGKWHLGWNWAYKEGTEGKEKHSFDDIDYSKPISHSPNDLGFDYAYGHIASLDMAPYVYVKDEYVTEPPDRITVDTGFQSFWRKGPTGADFVHEEVTPNFFEKAMEYIAERADKKQPFFLYLPLPSPHTPILPVGEWKGKSGLNPYGDFVLMIDDYVGQIAKLLDEKGIKDNTMLIFTCDNGCSPRANYEELGDKGHDPSYIFRGHKADIFEGGHRVPFIVRWPDVIPPGGVSDKTICMVDLMATLAEITGYQVADNEAEDSFSFLSSLKEDTEENIERAPVIHHSINGSFAIRKGDWKLLLCPGSGGWSYPTPREAAKMDTLPPVQLYHLGNDPSETINLQSKYPDKVAELKDDLIRLYLEGRSSDGPMVDNDPPMRSSWEEPWFIKEMEDQ